MPQLLDPGTPGQSRVPALLEQAHAVIDSLQDAIAADWHQKRENHPDLRRARFLFLFERLPKPFASLRERPAKILFPSFMIWKTAGLI